MKRTELARMIDHTVLGPSATREAVVKLCREAIELNAASACVDGCHARLVAEKLQGTDVKVCIVIGFPHGMAATAAKACEARTAIEDGADELDMVINVAALKEGDTEAVIEDIRTICKVAKAAPRPVLVKAILETARLTDEEKVAGARLAKEAGADFVKTSTGFGPSGATVEDVALLRSTVGPEMGVKAAGGIRDYETAIAMIDAGATRIGASRSIDILSGAESDEEPPASGTS